MVLPRRQCWMWGQWRRLRLGGALRRCSGDPPVWVRCVRCESWGRLLGRRVPVWSPTVVEVERRCFLASARFKIDDAADLLHNWMGECCQTIRRDETGGWREETGSMKDRAHRNRRFNATVPETARQNSSSLEALGLCGLRANEEERVELK
jgi:hypothetical protein